MDKIRLLPETNSNFGEIIDVTDFEEKTHKLFPYYQTGSKYALCPTCGSSVQLIGGENNNTGSSKTPKLYAGHTPNEVEGLRFNSKDKKACPNYTGNTNNWQGIYKLNPSIADNKDVENYILANEDKIAEKLWDLTGIRFNNQGGVNKLYNEIYESFKKNNGLKIEPTKFVPEFIPRLLLLRANPIKFWGYILNDDNKIKVEECEELKDSFQGNQFKPMFEEKKGQKKDVKFVGVLDNDQNPQHLILKLVFEDKQIILKKISANI